MSTEIDKAVSNFLPGLIARVGKAIRFQVMTGGTFDQLKGRVTGETSSFETVICTPPGRPGGRSTFAREIEEMGSAIKGALEFLVPNTTSLSFIPKPGQLVRIDSEDWFVEATHPVRSGEDIAAFRVLVKR